MKRVFLASRVVVVSLLITIISVLGPVLALAADANLLVHYTFDTNNIATVVDQGMYGNNGGVVGASWIAGGVNGGGMSFDGANDYVNIGDIAAFSFTDGAGNDQPFSVSAWVNFDSVQGSGLVGKRSLSAAEWILMVPGSGTRLQIALYNSNLSGYLKLEGATVLPTGEWTHLASTYDGSETIEGFKLYVNGIREATNSTVTVGTYNGMSDTTAAVELGVRSSAYDPLDGRMDDVRLYNRELSAQEVADLYAAGAGADPILHYAFDTSNDVVVVDQGILHNDGVMDGATWIASAASGGGASFDGVDDYVDAGDAWAFSFTDGLGNDKPFSVSAWVYFDAVGGSGLVGKRSLSAAEWILMVPGGGTRLQIALYNSNLSGYLKLEGATVLPAGEWLHVVSTYDGSEAVTGLRLYVDGIPEATNSAVTVGSYAGMSDTAAPLELGVRSSAYDPLDGMMDDVRIYDKVLSTQEVTALFAGGGKPTQPDILLHYTFDTNNGAIVVDQSSLGNNGGLIGCSWVSNGVSAGGMSFDGANDYVNVGDIADFSFTDGAGSDRPFSVCVWANFDAVPGSGLVGKRSLSAAEWLLMVPGSGTRLQIALYNSNVSGHLRLEGTTVLPTGEWVHLASTYDGSETVEGLRLYVNGVREATNSATTIGTYNGMSDTDAALELGVRSSAYDPFDGIMDGVLIYSRELPADEVSDLYAAGVPTDLILHYAFDTNTASTAVDLGVLHNDGIIEGPTWTDTAASGGGLSFDGVDDYVDAGDARVFSFTDGLGNDEPFSVSAWVSFNTVGGSTLAGKISASEAEWILMVPDGGSRLALGLYNSDFSGYLQLEGATILPAGEWVHVVSTYDGSEVLTGLKLYINGVLDATNSAVGIGTYTGMSNTLAPLELGIRSQAYDPLDGMMDEVRIYGRELAAREVRALYVAGVETDMVLRYTFDIDDGVTIQDQGLLRNDGMAVGASWHTHGVSLGAMDFDGVNDYVDVGDDESFSFTDGLGTDGPFSVAAWVKSGEVQGSALVSKRSGSAAEWIVMVPGGGGGSTRLQLALYNTDLSGYLKLEGATPLPSGAWVHVASTYDGSESLAGMRLYVNGVLEATNNAISIGAYLGMSDTDAALELGIRSGSSDPFDGVMDDVRVYSRVLSSSEIMDLYDSDGDRMSDGWESTYGLNNDNVADASGDVDDDGISNIDEHTTRTDPTNAASYLYLVGFDTSNGDLSVDWVGGPVKHYLEAAESMSNMWYTIGTVDNGLFGLNSTTVYDIDTKYRVFRVRVEP